MFIRVIPVDHEEMIAINLNDVFSFHSKYKTVTPEGTDETKPVKEEDKEVIETGVLHLKDGNTLEVMESFDEIWEEYREIYGIKDKSYCNITDHKAWCGSN